MKFLNFLVFICTSFFAKALADSLTNNPTQASTSLELRDPWTNINNVLLNDGITANCSFGAASFSDPIVATGFGFNFLPGDTLLGIQVLIKKQCSVAGINFGT